MAKNGKRLVIGLFIVLQILFIGSLSSQSLITLRGLLASGQSVSLVAVAGSTLGLGTASLGFQKRYIPVIYENGQDSILRIAAEQGIAVESLDPSDTGEQLRAYTLDVGIVSCYPHRLHDALLQLPRFGCYNLHPSLLPKYRGPTPLFWQFRHGESEGGVTLHRMNHRIDGGDIVAQQRITISDGMSERDLSGLCATRGTALIQSMLQQLEQNFLKPTAQSAPEASYHSWPNEQDFHIKTDWPARRIYNFICGTENWGHPYTLHIDNQLFLISSVEGFSKQIMPDKQYKIDGKRIRFNCYGGSVEAWLAI